MDLRWLKAFLGALNTAGVAKATLDDNLKLRSVEFGAAPAPVPTGEVEGLEQDWTQGAPTGLQQAYERIQKAYEQKPKSRRAS